MLQKKHQIACIIWILIFPMVIYAQQSTTYNQRSFSRSNGSTNTSSASYQLKATIGQTFIGNTSSANHTLSAGFDAASSAATVRLPDLTFVQSPPPAINPTSVAPGGETSATFTIRNAGDADAEGGIVVKAYLSVNTTFDAGDIELAMFNVVDNLAAGVQYAFPGTGQSGKITIPANTLVGSYQVLFFIDPENLIAEKNESSASNIFATPLTVATSPINQLKISSPATSLQPVGYKISVTLSDGSGDRTVKYYYKGITATTFNDLLLSSSNDVYEATVSPSMLDEIGLEYYFEASDATTITPIKTTNAFIYSSFAANQQTIPGLSFGGQAKDYRIIAVPYKLDNSTAGAVFSALGGFDKTKWRLVRYENGKNRDVQAFDAIRQGHGYWFNALATGSEAPEIKLGEGTAPQNNQSNPFKLPLSQGWNQIGDPYPFDIKWSDVLAANPGKAVGSLKVFNPANASLVESNDLLTWSGGFVHADEALELEFPVTLKHNAGGRMDDGNPISNSALNESIWYVPLTLIHGIGENSTIGFGMHTQASDSKDRFDDITVPRFLNYLEMHTEHPEFFSPNFGRDVVKTKAQYTWSFSINSNYGQGPAVLYWQPEYFGNNSATLYLYDVQAQVFVNMKSIDNYRFDLQESRQLKMMYAIDERGLQPDFTILGRPYPNPMTSQTTIPLIVKEDYTSVFVYVQDMMGKQVKVIARDVFNAGIHELHWNVDDNAGNKLSPAVYLLRMESSVAESIVHKLIVK